MSDPLDAERRSALLAIKLRTLVNEHRARSGSGEPAELIEPRPFAAGAAVIDADRSAWVLVDQPGVGLGAALAWATREDTAAVHVVVDGARRSDAATIARQATTFASSPTVWTVDGRTLVALEPVAAPAPTEPSPEALALVPELERVGLDIVIEGGVVRGEVRGLEVAVIVTDDDRDDDGEGDDVEANRRQGRAARIEVGVGRHDREAFAMLHGELPTQDALRTVVEAVAAQRRPGAAPHPLNRLAPERWLRWHLLTDRARLVGWHVEPLEDVVVRASLNDRVPAFACGTDAAGAEVVLACSVGIDLELVPVAAEVRQRVAADHRLVLAMPVRDALAPTRRLAEALVRPAEVLAIEGDWRR